MQNLPLLLSHLFKHPLLTNAQEEAAKPALGSSRGKKFQLPVEPLRLWDNRSETTEAVLGRMSIQAFY